MINVLKSIRSFKFAMNGIYYFFKNENNARVHLLASVIVLIAGFYFELNRNDWLWIALAIALVWITEAMNTAIEKIVDFISPEFDSRAGAMKDLAAAAVLFAALFAGVIGCLIFWPHLIRQ